MALSNHALTTVQRVRDLLQGRDSIPAAHDALIEFLINAVSENIERYCNRHFERATYTDLILSAQGGQELFVPYWPIVSVASIEESLDGGESWQAVPASEYIIFPHKLFRKQLWPSAQGKWIPNVRLTFTAGWVLPKDLNPDLPPDLEFACARLVVLHYKLREKEGLGGESFEGMTLEFDRWPADIRAVLDRYRVVKI
jgi:hypothetical protein